MLGEAAPLDGAHERAKLGAHPRDLTELLVTRLGVAQLGKWRLEEDGEGQRQDGDRREQYVNIR